MYDAILFISGLMDVQLPVIRRSKQQLFTGVKVVPHGEGHNTIDAENKRLPLMAGIQLIHG